MKEVFRNYINSDEYKDHSVLSRHILGFEEIVSLRKDSQILEEKIGSKNNHMPNAINLSVVERFKNLSILDVRITVCRKGHCALMRNVENAKG